VADNKQFGSPKVPGNQPGDTAHCAQCEAMLADALDGTLTPTDQLIFDSHMAHCGPCCQMLADARRGAAWLEMLRDPRPEPPAELLEKILLRTSGTHDLAINPALQESGGDMLPVPIHATPGAAPAYGKVLPFRARFTSVVRASSFILQPRFAMTAAMAFFSIALTLSLTGVRLQDLHASDFRPSSIQRDFSSANARVVRYYEGLRVVYELESRVHDLESTSDTDAPAGTQTTPQTSSPEPDQPPAAQPAPDDQKATPAPARKQPEQKRPAPNPGTSRREDLNQPRHLVAATRDDKSFRNPVHARVERTLA
jgi:Putative zinc-finger